MNLMVTANQKPINRYTHKGRNPNITLDSHHMAREESRKDKRNKKELWKQPKAINKMAVPIDPSVITLNVNRLSSPIRTEWTQP